MLPLWAVITGGSDGIGFAISKRLAELGYGIAIVGRNREKTEGKLEEIRKLFPGTQTKAIIADIGQLTKLADYEQIELQTRDINVKYLVLSAGLCTIQTVTDMTDREFQDMIVVNAVSVAMLIKVFMARLTASAESKPEPGILILGSGIRAVPAPCMNLYSSTKHFVNCLSHSLGYELQRAKSKVRIVCYEPGGTDTKMTRAAQSGGGG